MIDNLSQQCERILVDLSSCQTEFSKLAITLVNLLQYFECTLWTYFAIYNSEFF